MKDEIRSSLETAMKNTTLFKILAAGGLSILLLGLPPLYRSRSVFAQSARESGVPAGDGMVTTTLADQSELALTVYNSDIALVRDVRQITLAAGDSRLRFMGIAASVNPATGHFRSLTEPAKLSVLEQNYEYDLLDPNKLLQKYVGREVTMMRGDQEVKATLLSDNGGQVWKIGNDIVTNIGYNSLRFPEVPDNLYERPTLLWSLENSGARKHKVEASYMTS